MLQNLCNDVVDSCLPFAQCPAGTIVAGLLAYSRTIAENTLVRAHGAFGRLGGLLEPRDA
jgi:hypothetical protein